jgi:hypothetical protein
MVTTPFGEFPLELMLGWGMFLHHVSGAALYLLLIAHHLHI